MGDVLKDIEALLKSSFGLDASTIGSTAIARAVAQRMVVVGSADERAYWSLLSTRSDEVQELTEAVIVPETWFFRDGAAFGVLAEMAADRWARAPGEAVLRVLSLPCSTGEEPYSAAIALLEAGLPAQSFVVDAIDISHRSLTIAREAIYGLNAFRGTEASFRARHFTQVGDRHSLCDAVKSLVHFRQGNLLSPDDLPVGVSYDFVFCRNLLIYFDRPTQRQALTALRRLLRTQGVLFVGPAESVLLMQNDFQSLRRPLAFAFRGGASPRQDPGVPAGKASPSAVATGMPRRRPSRAPAPLPKPVAPVPMHRAAKPPVPPTGLPRPDVQGAELFDRAARLADQGRLPEAKTLCQDHLRACPDSAPAHHLLGLIHDGMGDHANASACYRKALYLDPEHEEALLQLAYLLQGRGEVGAAQRMRERAERVRARKGAKG